MSKNPNTIVVLIVAAVLAASAATVVLYFLSPYRQQTASSETVQMPGSSGTTSVDVPIIPNQTPELLDSMKILSFNLVDQNNNPVDEHIFDGQVTLVDFMFTRCPGPCPLMTSELVRIQKALRGTGVRIVSFSVDADHDGPAVLQQYARNYGADLKTWTFITGDPQQIADLAIKGLGFALDRSDPVQGSESQGPNILHPTHFILVGPDRKILGIAGFSNQPNVDLLVAGARRLAERLQGG